MNGRTTGEQPSDRRVPVANLEEVLRLYRDTYFDLNMRHFHEKLSEEHGIELSYTFVQKACKERADENVASTADEENGGRCQACCCTLVAASTSGSATSAGTT